MAYNFKEVEKKWQNYWEKNKTFKTDEWDFSKPKFYALDMFPYPSASGLHVGHVAGYTATDIVSRMKRMEGYNVLHPMGWDAFGLPAEQFAVQTGNHPEVFTRKNIDIFRKQLKSMGLSYDWDREFATCDTDYYKWTQWIFKKIYEKGLAKYVDMPVNWCEGLGTVLSNDEIIDGKSERGGFPVVRKNMKQWVLNITDYAETLLQGLEELDWPESTKEIQRNWIGKSVGAEIEFNVENSNEKFTVFTTRPDTIYGATYCVLAPEHPLVNKITTDEQKDKVEEYVKKASSKSDLERTELNKEKTGVFTGGYAINPLNKKLIPIWISDYVLMTYAKGAIMAVPAHDERDYEFAKKFGIEIIPVLKGGDIENEAFVGDGLHINSDILNGMDKKAAIEKIIDHIEQNKIGTKKVNYKLHDWIFARQRYWGEPVPVIFTENDEIHVISDEELPVVLPELEDYKPNKDGSSALSKKEDWVNVEINGVKGRRETGTMPGAAGSSWYFLRYIDPHNKNEIADKKLLEHWLPVDLYMGGPEHAVGHLLYSRFWNNFLHDEGYVPVKEPFYALRHQGMIQDPNGIKMSKSKGNGVNPDEMVELYGADALRVYEMFMGPIEASKPWDPNGMEGSKKFIDRVWRLFVESGKVSDKENKNLEKAYNYTVKKVTDDFKTMNFNTAISQMMIFINSAYKEEIIPKEYAKGFIKILNPVAPHISEEIWSLLGGEGSISNSDWPSYDPEKIVEDVITIPVQVNGKVRANIQINFDEAEETVKEKAHLAENVKIHIEDKEIVKEIYVKNKIYNIVVK